MSARAALLVCLALAALSACRRTGLPGMVPVRGKVILEGVPLAGVEIRYVPQDKTGRSARATLDADGSFVLTTLHIGDGALPGTYRVLVLADIAAAAGDLRDAEKAVPHGASRPQNQAGSAIPVKYARPELTPLRDEVDDDHPGYREFVLTKD